MVRFIITNISISKLKMSPFTFQYGQIYYILQRRRLFSNMFIYIPIWLDLLSNRLLQASIRLYHLHSNMVRFIIKEREEEIKAKAKFTFQYGQIYYKQQIKQQKDHNSIYIPIWLDLLYALVRCFQNQQTNLHSNMVRFIIKIKLKIKQIMT